MDFSGGNDGSTRAKKRKSIPNSRDERVQKNKKSIANCKQKKGKSKVPSLTPYERKVDGVPMDFPRQENRP